MSEIKIPYSVRLILERLENAGFEAYLVGGCVRDMIMGRPIHDWDLTTSAPAEVTMELFEKAIPTGIKYGTVTVIYRGTKAEITTFRADGEYSDGRHPEGVRFVKTLAEDLARRDFTINAMAMDMRMEITDLFGGKGDIERRIIKCVGEPEQRFSEDALRMMRAVRFSAWLGFEIEECTKAAAACLGEKAADLSSERVLEETVKTLLSPKPEKLALAFEWGIFKGKTEVTPQTEALRRIGRMKKDASLRLCALALSMGDYEFLQKLRADSKTIKLYKAAVSECYDSEREIKMALARFGRESVYDVCAVLDGAFGTQRVRKMNAVIKQGTVVYREQLLVSGDDLISAGIEKGPKIGDILNRLLYHVNDKPEDNSRDKLLALAKKMYMEA